MLRFGLTSAALAGVFGALLIGWLSGFIRQTSITHAEDTATYSMRLALNALDVAPDRAAALTPAQYAQTTAFLRSVVATKRYVGATAWVPPDVVAYAVEPGRTGNPERIRPQITQALNGKKASLVVHAPAAGIPDETERVALRAEGPLLEVFIPVRLGGPVVAAVVLYQTWRPIERHIDHETYQMLWLVGGGLIAFWLGLMSFVLSADRRLKAQATANWWLASHDSLTGLPNRKLLRERVEQALHGNVRSGRKVGLLLFDLDRFKEVNDTLGHHSGDLLLEQIGPRLKSMLREGDSVARLGGDEFVVLLPDLADASEASLAAERVTAALTDAFELDGISLDIEASIGIAISPDHGTDFDTLLQHADIGMYAAKSAGSPFAEYTPQADRGSIRKLEMLGQLRRALNDPSQFVVHYQPVADLVTGEVRGLEALTRWQHPTEGLLSPSEFIPLAERAALINPLTDLILEAVLTQAQAWAEAGLQLPISVNISTRCLLDATFPELLTRLLHEHRVPPHLLDLEITESVIMADPERTSAVLARLKELGIRLCIDDFGTGYSSMGYLKQLPVHRIKIDQSFVTNMTEGSPDAAIVQSCIELARNLGLSAVAEGVETAAVWHQLTELGCQLAQGFYLAAPMVADAVHPWLIARARVHPVLVL